MPGTPGHVVDAVAGQGLDVDHLGRRHAELLHHVGDVDGLQLDRVEHRHALADELHEVLVGGDDDDARALGAGEAAVAGDEVVGLVAVELDGGQGEGVRRLADEAELGLQLVGRLGAVGLVGGIDLVAEVAAGGVEDDGDILGLEVRQQLDEHVGEAVDGIDGRAVRPPRHHRQGVEGAEDEARAVDEVVGARRRHRGACGRGRMAPGPRTKRRPQ